MERKRDQTDIMLQIPMGISGKGEGRRTCAKAYVVGVRREHVHCAPRCDGLVEEWIAGADVLQCRQPQDLVRNRG